MTQHPLDPAGARIVDRLHRQIADLIDGNHVQRAEVVKLGGRSCPCHVVVEVDWTFTSYASTQRNRGNTAVSTHFGYDRHQHDAETSHRCDTGRTHKPIREAFMASVLAAGNQALAESGQSKAVWDFGQHSVHEQCSPCRGSGRVNCSSCHGSGRSMCYQCSGSGATTQTRWVQGHNGQGRHESYQQTCSGCGGGGRVTCRQCNGSGDEQCHACGGHGFYTDITSVTVQAEPHVNFTTRSDLSADALPGYLAGIPVSAMGQWLDFNPFGDHDTTAQTWRVGYETLTTVAELDLQLRQKTYLAAAVGDKALAFVRPPIFDDVFIEEITDLHKIWSGKKKSFNNERARHFFDTYAGQPVLDCAMKAVAKLKGAGQGAPEQQVIAACDGYISRGSAQLLARCMVALLDKVSPPYSLWSWAVVMAVPFALLLLSAQNSIELRPPSGFWSIALTFAWTAVVGGVATLLVSPLAVTVSALVSAIRRRAVPKEYRQHGRNWQPMKGFVLAGAVATWAGVTLGLATHHAWLPRWDNRPLQAINDTLQVTQRLGVALGRTPGTPILVSSPALPLVSDVQHNLAKLGYAVPLDGQLGQATQDAVDAYMRKKKLKATDLKVVLKTLCRDLKGRCANTSAIR